MKTVILSSLMALFMFVGLSSMMSADPPYNATDCQTDCELFVEMGLFSGQGACMSACTSCTNPSNSVASQANCQCNLIDEFVGLENTLWGNKGQCMVFWKGIFSGS